MAAFYQVLQGLEGLYSKGFIYQDIKPSNIGVVIILDYRETIRAKRYKPYLGKAGTIPFLAPEMEQRPYSKERQVAMAQHYKYRGYMEKASGYSLIGTRQ
ncbi:hypothetical protein LAWI1_G007200 [Lachnellula willkommii]|uniref:Protein kinase domain-containing protein n=1 Tax=Lachnellula willkommii TaxID=215461 RepID=A0A559M616_9HELO|nr:hypothetical protein LAWI1_G007200 [Lachnellula willkommii]